MSRPMRASRSSCGPDRVTNGELHIWTIDLDAPPASGRTALRRAEFERASSYLWPRAGARFAVGRAWLRAILSCYLGDEPDRLEFGTDSTGRPVLVGEHAGLIHFSLSRSGDRALAAVSDSPVGADIELVRDRTGLADLIAARFSPAEARCIAAGCGGSPLRGFYRHWTAKEAYLKATGRGLAGLRTTELACGVRPVVRAGGHGADWTLSLLDLAPDFATAIVGAGPVTRYRTASQ